MVLPSMIESSLDTSFSTEQHTQYSPAPSNISDSFFARHKAMKQMLSQAVWFTALDGPDSLGYHGETHADAHRSGSESYCQRLSKHG